MNKPLAQGFLSLTLTPVLHRTNLLSVLYRTLLTHNEQFRSEILDEWVETDSDELIEEIRDSLQMGWGCDPRLNDFKGDDRIKLEAIATRLLQYDRDRNRLTPAQIKAIAAYVIATGMDRNYDKYTLACTEVLHISPSDADLADIQDAIALPV